MERAWLMPALTYRLGTACSDYSKTDVKSMSPGSHSRKDTIDFCAPVLCLSLCKQRLTVFNRLRDDSDKPLIINETAED